MPRRVALLSLLVVGMVAPAGASSLTFADVCEPNKLVQTTKGLEVYCAGATTPWLTIVACARPATASAKKVTYCAGLKYLITCTPAKVAQEVEVPGEDVQIAVDDPEPVLLACGGV